MLRKTAAIESSSGKLPVSMAAPPPEPQEQWRANLNIHMICKDCKEVPPNLVENFSSGDMVCGSCGLVLGERIIDTRSEWRTFQNDDSQGDDPSRVGDGGNPLLNGSQLETTIAYGDGSAKSRELARAQSKTTHNKANKNLLSAYKEIGAYCEAMSVQKTATDLAKLLFKQVMDAGAFKGKSQDALIAGCIVIACRQNGVGRSFKEIWALTKVPKAEIGRVFKQLSKFFDNLNKEKKEANASIGEFPFIDLSFSVVELTRREELIGDTSATNAEDLVSRYGSHLGLSHQCNNLSKELAIKTKTLGPLAGRSPLSVAAACIYMSSYLMGTGKTAKEISNVCGVSDGTIRTAYKLLYPGREQLIDKKWLQPEKGADMKRLPPI